MASILALLWDRQDLSVGVEFFYNDGSSEVDGQTWVHELSPVGVGAGGGEAVGERSWKYINTMYRGGTDSW